MDEHGHGDGHRHHDHVDHHHHHGGEPTRSQLLAAALESLVVEKGLLSSDMIDRLVDVYEKDIGPMIGARLVARAWADPAYKRRLLTKTTEALAEMGVHPVTATVAPVRMDCIASIAVLTLLEESQFTLPDSPVRARDMSTTFCRTVTSSRRNDEDPLTLPNRQRSDQAKSLLRVDGEFHQEVIAVTTQDAFKILDGSSICRIGGSIHMDDTGKGSKT